MTVLFADLLLKGGASSDLFKQLTLTLLESRAAKRTLQASLAMALLAATMLLAALYLWVLFLHGHPAALAITGAVLLLLAGAIAAATYATLQRRRRKLERITHESAQMVDALLARISEEGQALVERHPMAVALSACVAGAVANDTITRR